MIKGNCKNCEDDTKIELSYIKSDSTIIQDIIRLHNVELKFCTSPYIIIQFFSSLNLPLK